MVEVRTVNQVRIYLLVMNPMQDRTESRTIAAISDDYQKLVNWIKGEKHPEGYWKDDRWSKSFKANSVLEWFNPPDRLELNQLNHYGHGIKDEWVMEDAYKDMKNGIDKRFYFVH